MKDTRLIAVVISIAFCASVWGAAKPDLVGWQQTGQDAYFFKVYDAGTQALLTQVKWGQQIQINYMIKNIGLAKAGAFHVNFYLSKDSTIGNSDDIKLGYAYWNTGLAAGTYSKKTSPTLKIPSTMSGAFSETSDFYLGMKIDPNSKVTETIETNNYNQAVGKDKRSITQASRTITDNFDDNSRNAMWSPYFEDSSKCWLAETSKHLEILATSGSTIQQGATLFANGFRIIPSRDFSISFDYYHNLASTNETGIYCGLVPDSGKFNRSLSFGIDREPECYFWYSLYKTESSSEEYDDTLVATSGKLYLSYSISKDELYLSNVGTGSANSVKTFKGLLKGTWGGKPLYLFIGGDTYNATIGSGLVYIDNFSCTGLLGVCKPYYYTDDFADGTIASFWNKIEQSPSKIYETGGRLEFRTASKPSDYVDSYYIMKTTSSSPYIDPTRDFMCSVNFVQLMANTTGDTGVWIGIATSTLDNKLTLAAGRDDTGGYFEYEAEGALNTGADTARSINSGKLYISYSSAADEVYLSWTDFGKENAKWTVKGAVKGKWKSKPLIIAIGAWSDGVIVPTGKIYLDNFTTIGEKK